MDGGSSRNAPGTRSGIFPEQDRYVDHIFTEYSYPYLAAIANVDFPFSTDFYWKEGIQDSLTLSPGRQAVGDTLAVPARALMDMTPIAETIQEGVNTFMDAVPVLMKALDEVAKIHPFISGASPLL